MTTTFGNLLPELLVKIFSHYIESNGHMAFSRNVGPVCRTWWQVSSTPSLYKSVHVLDWNYVKSLSKRGLLRHTEHLHIGAPKENCVREFLDPLHLSTVLPSIHNLRSLKITESTIDANGMMIVAEHCPNLEHFHLDLVSHREYKPLTIEELGPILTVCGPKLKHLVFRYEIGDGEELITEVAAKCPLLEVFEWDNQFLMRRVMKPVLPIFKLKSACPRLRVLVINGCTFDNANENDCISGFEDLTVFKVTVSALRGLDLGNLLKDSKNLHSLEIKIEHGLDFKDLLKIPSNKIRSLTLAYYNMPSNTNAFEQLVDKWKRTLLRLEILTFADITNVLKIFVDYNAFPNRLEEVQIQGRFPERHLMKKFIQCCPNLNRLKIYIVNLWEESLLFTNREQILKFEACL